MRPLRGEHVVDGGHDVSLGGRAAVRGHQLAVLVRQTPGRHRYRSAPVRLHEESTLGVRDHAQLGDELLLRGARVPHRARALAVIGRAPQGRAPAHALEVGSD